MANTAACCKRPANTPAGDPPPHTPGNPPSAAGGCGAGGTAANAAGSSVEERGTVPKSGTVWRLSMWRLFCGPQFLPCVCGSEKPLANSAIHSIAAHPPLPRLTASCSQRTTWPAPCATARSPPPECTDKQAKQPHTLICLLPAWQMWPIQQRLTTSRHDAAAKHRPTQPTCVCSAATICRSSSIAACHSRCR